jgi:hypothetical protein
VSGHTLWAEVEASRKLACRPGSVHRAWARLRYRYRPDRTYHYARRWWQRRRRGWADADLSRLDRYLAGVISETVTRVLEITGSYPVQLTEQQWTQALEAIAGPLQAYRDTPVPDGARIAAATDALRLLADHFPDLMS